MGMNRNMMRQMQQLQSKLEKAQNELGEMTVEGTAGGGVVTVVMDGHQTVRSVSIAPEAVDPEDIETLEDLVIETFRCWARLRMPTTRPKTSRRIILARSRAASAFPTSSARKVFWMSRVFQDHSTGIIS